MISDIEIAQKNKMEPIVSIANTVGLCESDLDLYGQYKAKISMKKLRELHNDFKNNKKGKLILVTACTPTPAGEGKSTVSIGLGDGLSKIGKKTIIALREPSLGPCFGVKGGACGGGYAQIVPMEDINLHFTGDIHGISIANNMISDIIDNSLQQGNPLNIDSRTISWKRCVDINDRALRNINIGLGGKVNGVPREDHFCISVASEIMAIVCLSRSIAELKNRIDNIIIGKSFDGRSVKFAEFNCTGAIAALLKDAIRPNLVQTLEKTPAFVHGGPFANIAHGCNSVNATISALACSDYVVTEAGFAADLGAEKFFDIKCRVAGLNPSAVVLVATIRALKMHGGVLKNNLSEENLNALEKGFENLSVHIENIKKYNLPIVVAINRFESDSEAEIKLVEKLCANLNCSVVLAESWGKGGEGSKELAQKVVELCESSKSEFKYLYSDELPLKEKIETIAKEIYRAKNVDFSSTALKKLAQFTEEGFGNLPVCIAKTQNSISHDPKLVCAPKDYTFPVRDIQLYSGAGFVVVLSGDIMTMPGLPKQPAALNIDVDDDGVISGLF